MSLQAAAEMKVHWIQSHLGKWHAWPAGGRATLCGRVNVEHLRDNPADNIQIDAPSPDQKICAYCAKRTGVLPPVTHDDPCAALWLSTLRLRMSHKHIKVSDVHITKLAELLAELGPPGTFNFQPLADFLLKTTWTNNRPTLPQLKEALTKLPPKTCVLRRISSAIETWRNITGKSLSTENFNTARVIEVILQLPDPEAYIRHLHSRGLSHFAAVFHPNTLERAKKEPTLRGLFSGSTQYWDATASQLNIVTE